MKLTKRQERAFAEYNRAMREEVIPAIERDLQEQARIAARLRLGLPAEAGRSALAQPPSSDPVTTSDQGE